MYFAHNTQNSLLLLIHVQVQCDLVITRNTCVNVCSLNCLDLFLKYKIGYTCCVCVCVCVCLDPKCFTFSLLWDVFKSLKCWLDLWLSSLLDCIHLCFFSFSKNCFYQAWQLFNRSQQIAIYQDTWTVFSRQILSHLLSIEAFWNLSR